MIDTLEQFEAALAGFAREDTDSLICSVDGYDLALLRRGDHATLRGRLPGPGADSPRHLRQALELGLASALHYDAGLACRPEDRSLWLSRPIADDRRLDLLSDDVETLLRQLDVWRDQLEAAHASRPF